MDPLPPQHYRLLHLKSSAFSVLGQWFKPISNKQNRSGRLKRNAEWFWALQKISQGHYKSNFHKLSPINLSWKKNKHEVHSALNSHLNPMVIDNNGKYVDKHVHLFPLTKARNER